MINGLGTNTVYEAPVGKKTGPYFFAAAGGGVSNLQLTGNDIYVARLHFKQVNMPFADLGIDLRGPRGLQYWVLRFEVSYTSANYSGQGVNATASDLIYYYQVKQTNISPAVNLLHNFVHGRMVDVYALAFGCIACGHCTESSLGSRLHCSTRRRFWH